MAALPPYAGVSRIRFDGSRPLAASQPLRLDSRQPFGCGNPRSPGEGAFLACLSFRRKRKHGNALSLVAGIWISLEECRQDEARGSDPSNGEGEQPHVILTCANCGKKEGPTATYCRDCYTVFPFEVRAAALRGQEKRRGIGAWKWLPVIALFIGGIVLFQFDFGQPAQPDEPEEEKRDEKATPAPRASRPAARKNQEPAWADLKDRKLPPRSGEGGRLGRAKQKRNEAFVIAPSIAATSRYVGWVLKSDTELACPSARPCAAAIKFSSGERGAYAIERWEGTSNNVVPADAQASHLLNVHEKGRLDMQLPDGRTRSVDMEKKSNRWLFSGADGL